MKVLHIVPAVPFGGAQRSVTQLAGQQRREGLDARVLTLYHNDILTRFIEHHKVPYYTTGRHTPLDLRAWGRLARIVKRIDPDIIHLHLALFWSLSILSLPFMKKCPWVYHARVFRPVRMALKDRLIRWLLCSKIDAVIGNSKAVTKDMQEFLGPAIPVYRTIYNGIFLPDATVFSERTMENNDVNGRPRIGMATRFDHNAGIKEFIDATINISRQLPGARFVLAGEGPLLPWARRYSASLGVHQVLSFLGFITNTPNFWSSLDFALFTAPHEAFGLRIIEPQATGTLVVGYYSGGGSDEIILSGQTGVLVPWGDREGLAREIAALWSDPARYQKMAEAARQRLQEEFSIQKTAQECIGLYQELLDARNLRLEN